MEPDTKHCFHKVPSSVSWAPPVERCCYCNSPRYWQDFQDGHGKYAPTVSRDRQGTRCAVRANA